MSCSTEATDHFISDEKNSVLVTDPLYFWPICLWRDDYSPGTLNWFSNESSYTLNTEFVDFLLKFLSSKDSVL